MEAKRGVDARGFGNIGKRTQVVDALAERKAKGCAKCG